MCDSSDRVFRVFSLIVLGSLFGWGGVLMPASAQEVRVAYVSSQYTGVGVLADEKRPYSSPDVALKAGARELRLAPGMYDGLTIDGGIVTIRLWNGQAGLQKLDAPGTVVFQSDVRIGGGASVILADAGATFHVKGDLLLDDGVLDLASNRLEMHGARLFVGAGSTLQGALQCGGVAFTGTDDTNVVVQTNANQLRNDFQVGLVVNKTGSGKVTFNAGDTPATTPPGSAPNNIDTIGLPCLEIRDGGVALLDGLDLLDIFTDYTQLDGDFLMAGVSSVVNASQPTRQTVRTGGDFIEDNGEFFTNGGDVEVFGDFLLGNVLDANGDRRADPEPGDALFSLAFDGEHTVVGDFFVGPNTDDTEGPAQTIQENRNRYFLGQGELDLFGDYTFLGTGDRFDDTQFLQEEQGLDGTVFFLGNQTQRVWMRQDEDAFFADVVMHSAEGGGLVLESNAWQNVDGVLTLELGVIDTSDEAFDWIILNPGFEPELFETNNADRGKGVVELGSRDSYINGAVDRRVEEGNAQGGVVRGGYLFPVGVEGEDLSGGGTTRDVDFFRPLILQFPDDLGRSSLARVNYVGGGDAGEDPDPSAATCTLPAGGLVVDAAGGGTLNLDVISNQFWQLDLDRIPNFDPNVRVEASGLPNIFDIKSLRLVQWDCDCTNPRLAGVYDVDTGPVDDGSAVLNDFIDGVPNLTQEGVEVNECNIIGIASNRFINRIDDSSDQVKPLQIINATNVALDISLEQSLLVTGLDAGKATPFGAVPAVASVLRASGPIVQGTVFVSSITLEGNATPGHVLAFGKPGQGDFGLALHEARPVAADPAQVDFVFTNAITTGNSLSVTATDLQRTLPSIDLGEASPPGGITPYHGATPSLFRFDVSDAVAGTLLGIFTVDLNGRDGEALTFVISEDPSNKANGIILTAYDARGRPLPTADVTATDPGLELPTAFVLHGNYPNPFNPATTLRFDLPESAEVRVVVYDVLGRSVLTLAPGRMAAGADRTLTLDASALTSGVYIYRVLAEGMAGTHRATGRMMLVK